MGAAEKLSITLPSDMVGVIKNHVEQGRYASTSELMRDAMRLWMRQEEEYSERLQSIRARIAQSLNDPRASVPIEDAFSSLETQFNDDNVQ